MRKDILAAGGRKASYAVSGKADDAVELKNVAPEGSRDESVPEITPVEIVRRKFIPTEGVLLVRRHEPATVSGLLITDLSEKEKPAEGTVLEIGVGSSATVGSHVVFGKYAGTEFNLNGEVLLLIDKSDIKGFIVDESPVETLRNLSAHCIPGVPRC